MATFSDLVFTVKKDGEGDSITRAEVQFANGYGASIIPEERDASLYEVATLRDGRIEPSVARYLNPEQVTAQLAEIEARENPDSRDQAEPTDPRVRALAAHLGCEIDEIDESRYQPNDNEATDFEAEGKEFRVLTDDEADEAASAYIKDSLWAFSPNFLVEHMGLPYDAVPMLRSFAEKECEGANDTFRAMVKDFDGLVRDAISSDGRGHFLGGYDFNFEENEAEIDGETFYIYRTN
jgi:hypothetical protein